MRSSVSVLLSTFLLGAFVAGGCSKAGNGNGDGGGPNGDGGGGNGDMAVVDPAHGLVITPANPVLTVVPGASPQTVQLMASRDGQSVAVRWSVDRGEIGGIDSAGLFTTTTSSVPGSLGGIGGVARVTAIDSDNYRATTTVTVKLTASDNGDPAYTPSPPPPGPGGYGGVGGDGPGGPVTPTQQGTLDGTPSADATVKLLYPYDNTVWPRGLPAPLLQWDAGAHHFDAAVITVAEKNFQYKGYFAANKIGAFINLPIPQKAWDLLTYSNGGEAVTISISLAEGDKLYGPYTESWKVAPATLKGTIYYNSYGTYLATNSATDGLDVNGKQYGAATLAIKVGDTEPHVVAGVNSANPTGDGTGCRVCHTVSQNGKVLVTQASNFSASDYSATQILDLLNDTTNKSGTKLPTANLTYPALYPDGSLLFSSAGGFINTQATSGLFALPAGNLVTTDGLPTGFQAALPVFSPDGAELAFNFYGGSFGNNVNGDQRSLGMLDFDLATKKFSNGRILYTPPNDKPVTFSSFLPNESGIIFQIELGNPSGTWAGTWKGDTAELWFYDLKSSTAHRLDRVNGLGYLPTNTAHPAGLDATVNYEPTVNPIASGGYAWVVFTSRRMYGNVATEDPWMSDPRNYDANTHITPKKLWVAAIDLNPDEIGGSASDRSHPAFYLPAQEIHAGNSRGFWTVDPCHVDGTSCQTGDECCGGYCSSKDGALVCSSDKPECSHEFDRCDQDADCCPGEVPLTCINHVCSQEPPIS